jgi:hypothetical protein
MTEDLLDFAEEEQRIDRHKTLGRLQGTLLSLLLVIVAGGVTLIFVKIPIASKVSSPAYFAGWKTTIVISSFFVLVLCFAAVLLALPVGMIPVKGYPYIQRFHTAFLLVCILIEGIGLSQLVVDFLKSSGF